MTEVSRVFAAIARDSELVLRHAFDRGEDRGPYCNFTFGTDRPADLWREIQRLLFDDPALGASVRACAMAMCSSEAGWDDYLLLFHFDPAVSTQSIESTRLC